MPIDLEFHFQILGEIIWALHSDYSQYKKKAILGIFVHLFIYKVTMIKCSLLETSQATTRLIWERPILSSNIPLYIGKNLMEKLCKVLEMELKTYMPVSLKFIFEKSKCKVLHYIQHEFICQCPGLSKDQISMFKRLVINCFILKCHHTF